MFADIFSVFAGFLLLFAGGEALVRGAVSVATRLGLSTMLVGVVIVGFGTSTPELLVSVEAALKGTPDIAFGNVVGSNIANTLLILGTAAVISPVVCAGTTVRRDGLAVIVASIVLAALSLTGELGRLAGLLMVLLLASYLFYSYRADRRKMEEGAKMCKHLQEDFTASDPVPKALAYVAAGLVMLLFGANLLVNGATSLARAAGISEAVIGLTLVAIGTSLPELATAVVAAYKKHTDVLIGNVLGSNLFNILSILGITAIVTPVPFAGRIADIDVWLMLALAVIFYGIIHFIGRISRPGGALFLAVYTGYCIWLFNA